MDRMLLVLKPSAEQQAALDQLIADQHDPSSPRFHQWLTPAQFGEQFGAAAEDIDTISAWLRSKGFRVTGSMAGRRSIEFSGASGQVERAFHTEMHHYSVAGTRHLANATDIAIPAALADVVAGVASLNDFHSAPLHTMAPQPLFNAQGGVNAIAPGDFATIYNVAPLYGSGIDGTGQTIAVVGRTNFNMSDVATFRSQFGLPGNNTQIVLNGSDPGIVNQNEEVEALLDVEWSGAVAKGAAIKFVLSASTNTTGGDTLSAQYIVNNNLAPVMTYSFGLCEGQLGSANQLYNGLWQQAAAQGMSVMVAAGDNGSAGCDNPGSTSPAQFGFGVNGLASTPYNTAIGGARLNENGSPSTYWSATNSAVLSSALSYIPEVVWNDSAYVSAGNSSNNLYAGSGGVSFLYATPAWQTGAGVPAVDPNTANQHHRYLPDVSLSAGTHDPYVIVLNGGLYGVGGTSAGAPSFAGIVALLDQYKSARIGNPAASLYSLASTYPAAFHDIVTGTDAVPCVNGSANCTPGSTVGTLAGWSAAAGYDLATGLGTVNAYNLVTNWPSAAPPAPVITSLSPNPMTGSASSQTLTINGSGFQSGLKVVLASAGTTITYPPAQIASVTAAQILVAVNVGTAAASWSVQVVNPNNAASNAASLTVKAPVVAPVISSLNPNPITGSNSPQTLTVNGSGFQNGPGLLVQVLLNGKVIAQRTQVTFISSSQLQVPVTTGTAAGNFGIEVVNPDGQTSAAVTLVVKSPVAPPAITSLSPNPLTHSATAQMLTINGSGFQAGLQVLLSYNGFTITVPAAQTTWISASQIQASVTLANGGRTIGVQAVNPAGQGSNVASLIVQ